jgi:putative transposase
MELTMPRQARLDAPGVLHHVMGRGIEGSKIFRNKKDRQDFLYRLGELASAKAWVIYAWALMPNHFHLLVQTVLKPLSTNMRQLMTGYVVNFNRRHKRFGHLFQNRYKSIVCEKESYLLELTRYIHLNPLRSGLVADLTELNEYPWSGHATLMGKVKREWQDSEMILSFFSPKLSRARIAYEKFMDQGVSIGQKPELVGGGLIRSAGGWSQVLSLRRHDLMIASDERILGNGKFIEEVLSQANQQLKETLRLKARKMNLEDLASRVSSSEKVDWEMVLSGSRGRQVVQVRRLFCQLAIRKLGYSGAEVARYLGATTSSINRLANSPELPQLHQANYAT